MADDDPVIAQLQKALGTPAEKTAPAAKAAAPPTSDDPVTAQLQKALAGPAAAAPAQRSAWEMLTGQKGRPSGWEALRHATPDISAPIRGLFDTLKLGGQLTEAAVKSGYAGQPMTPGEMVRGGAPSAAMLGVGGDIGGAPGMGKALTRELPPGAAQPRMPVAAPPARPMVPPSVAAPGAEVEARLGIPRGGETPTPVDVGQQITQNVQKAHAEQRAGVTQKFETAFAQPGDIHASQFEGYGTRLRGRLGEDPQNIVDATTPRSDKALKYLDSEISKFKITNKVGPQLSQTQREDITGINLRGVSQVRKNLVKEADAAEATAARFPEGTPQHDDARIMRKIVEDFDTQVTKSIEDGLFSGDKKVLGMLKDAQSSEAKYFKTFEHGSLAKAIVDSKKTPDEVANALFSMQHIGMSKQASEFWNNAKGLLEPETVNNYRMSMWDHIRDNPESVAKFLDSSVGRAMFNKGEQQLMLQAANQPKNTLRQEMVQLAIQHGLPILARGLSYAHHPIRGILRSGGAKLAARMGEAAIKRYGGVE